LGEAEDPQQCNIVAAMEEDGPMSCPFCGLKADGDYQIMVNIHLISLYECKVAG